MPENLDHSATALRSLLSIQEEILSALDPEKVIARIVAEALTLVPGAEGTAVELVTDTVLTKVVAAGSLEGSVGERTAIEGSLSGVALSLGAIVHVRDTENDPRVNRGWCRATGVRSMICVPLKQGSVAIGILQLCSSKPDSFVDRDAMILQHLGQFMTLAVHAADQVYRSAAATLTDGSLVSPAHTAAALAPEEPLFADVTMLSQLTGFVANTLGLEIVDYQRRLETRERVRRMLSQGGPTMVLQPIFDLNERDPVGYEALARFHGPMKRSPDVWFNEAAAVGLGLELEAASLRTALELVTELPDNAYLSINLSPEGATTPAIIELLAKAPPHRLVIEVTEHTVVRDYDQLNDSLQVARARGTRVAVDDAGAGYASMRHILRLKPDCIKLDIALTSGINDDPVRRAFAASLIRFAHEIDATIVAEGIETKEEVATLRDLGVRYGQGYFLGKPAPLKRTRPRRLPAHPANPQELRSSTSL